MDTENSKQPEKTESEKTPSTPNGENINPSPAEPAPQPSEKPASPATPPPVVNKPADPPKPAIPQGPPADIKDPIARTDSAPPMDRRKFIKWITIGWSAFAAVVAGYGALTLRFMFPNVLFEPKQSFLAGFPDEYPIGEVSERWKSKHAVWIVRDSQGIFVLSTVCTHLGCTPNWLGNDNKFKCPCHGSGFYKTGINFEGPAPRPLERFRIILTDDGEIFVDKTKKYQQEKGEWSDPESFIAV